MTVSRIINLINRRIECCNSALRDLYNLDLKENEIDIIRLENEIDTYKNLLSEIS